MSGSQCVLAAATEHDRYRAWLDPEHRALGSFADPFKSDPHLLNETTVHKPGDPSI